MSSAVIQVTAPTTTSSGGGGINNSSSTLVVKARYPIPLVRIVEYRDHLEYILSHPTDFTKYEVAEAYERFAISLFFYGNLSEAEIMLVQTMKARKGLPVTLSNCRCILLLGNIAFRAGDMTQAEAQFNDLIPASKSAGSKAFEAIGRSNLAVSKYEQGKLYDGIESAKLGIDASAKINVRDSEEHYRHVRIFLVGILKSLDFRKFETVLDDHPLPPMEKALLLSSCKFIQGKFNDAKAVLAKSIADNVDVAVGEYKDSMVQQQEQIREQNQQQLEEVKENLEVSNGDSDEGGKEGKEEGSSSACKIHPVKSLPKVGSDIENMLVSCAQTKYNMGILASKFPADPKVLKEGVDDEGLKQQIDIITAYIGTYKTFQIEEIKTRNPFNKGKLNENPDIECIDHVLSLLVVLSQLLISQGERIVKAFNPRKANIISRGRTAGLDIDADEFSTCRGAHLATLMKLGEFFSPSKLMEFRLGEVGTKFLNEEGKLIASYEKLERPTEITENTLSSMRLYDWTATKDMMTIANAFWSILEGNREEITAFSRLSNETLKTRHEVIISSSTGMKDKESKTLPAVPSFYMSNKDAKEGSKRKEEKEKRLKAIVAPNYRSNTLDNFTNRASILPFSSPFGVTDVHLLFSWVLCATGCPGLGIMCGGSKKTVPFDPLMIPNPNQKEPIENKKPIVYKGAEPEPSEDLLREARARLIEVENEYDERYKTSDSYLPGDKELRFMINVCLAKLSIQLNIKPNLQTYIATIEALSTDMVKDKAFCDPNLIALSRRCRLDYEDWSKYEWMKGASASSDKKLSYLCTEVIPMVKEYVHYAKLGGDVELQRDSLRKYMNAYIEISKVPTNPGDPALVHATLDKLETLFVEKDVEKKERSDCNWMRQYGRARAQQILKLYKVL